MVGYTVSEKGHLGSIKILSFGSLFSTLIFTLGT